MKKFALAVAAIIALSIPVSAFASTGTINAEDVARAFSLGQVNSITGSINDNLTSVNQNTSSVWENGQFTLSKDATGWYFSALSLNGVDVALDPNKPLRGLPAPASAIRTQFSVNVNAYDVTGRYVGWGNFFTQTLKKGDPISLILSPAQVHDFIPFALPAGVNASNLRLKTSDGSEYGYNTWNGGFDTWNNPSTSIAYVILDTSNGVAYQYGTIMPYQGDSSSTSQSVVSVGYIGGVVDMTSDVNQQGYSYLDNQHIDGNVPDPTTGVDTPAKVYMADAGGQMLFVSVSGLHGTIVVKQVVASGPLVPLTQITWPANPGGGTGGGVTLPAGYGQVIIEVFGTLDDPSQGYQFSVVRYNPTMTTTTTSPGKG